MKNKKPIQFNRLTTEERNPQTLKIDVLPTRGILALINREDQRVAPAVKRAIPQIARAVDAIVDGMKRGGRLIYVGAGTSGRLGILDAVESVPTFNTRPQQIQGLIAGGHKACYRAVEASEDNADAGVRDMKKRRVTSRDIVVGIAASGRTPYTLGAMRYAKSKGAATIALVNTPQSEMKRLAAITIECLTGPEALTGSTRLKAGTAQKMICNMLSTAAMIRLGAVYSNLMINVQMKNQKLLTRGVKILREMTGANETAARRALAASGRDLKVAAVMLFHRCNVTSAQDYLKRMNGNLRRTLQRK